MDDAIDLNDLLKTVSTWIEGLDNNEIQMLKLAIQESDDDFIRLFETPINSPIYRKFLIIVSDFLSILDEKWYYRSTSVLKLLKNRLMKRRDWFEDLEYCQKFKNYFKKIEKSPRWNKKKFVICLTHDVDYSKGYEYIPTVMELEDSYNVSSCWNILAGGPYEVDNKIIEKIKDKGHEVGLHGMTHDLAFGYRSPKKIKTVLTQSLEKLGLSNCGFRAPTLSYTYEMLKVLNELGFSYDSSIADIISGSYYPYKIPGTNMWELPLTTPQDSILLRDKLLKPQAAYEVIKSKIEKVATYNGVEVLLFHPSLVEREPILYEKTLEYICSRKDCWITKPETLISHLNKRWK